jgi:hypothetical protein
MNRVRVLVNHIADALRDATDSTATAPCVMDGIADAARASGELLMWSAFMDEPQRSVARRLRWELMVAHSYMRLSSDAMWEITRSVALARVSTVAVPIILSFVPNALDVTLRGHADIGGISDGFVDIA